MLTTDYYAVPFFIYDMRTYQFKYSLTEDKRREDLRGTVSCLFVV